MTPQGHYIAGRWQAPQRAETLPVTDPTTEAVVARVPCGTAAEADAGVQAARQAFAAWSARPLEERAALLERVADGLEARADALADLITQEVGMPRKLARLIQVNNAIASWRHYAGVARAFRHEEAVGHSTVVHEPIGVVACITPWNFPLIQVTHKVAPALAAGCTVVLKPSEMAPLTAYALAEVLEQAGCPPGVFNLVSGLGSEVGEALAAHPDVDMLSFTGSTRAGRRVAALGAETVKRVSLELGGKSAAIVLPDADLAQAVKATLGSCFLNSGQTCLAHTRLLVPRERLEEAKALARQAAAGYVVGDPRAPTTRLGPVASAAQRERVTGHIRRALAEGAERVTGGAEAPEGLDTGYFVQPTVLVATPDAAVAREEVFGPVLTLLAYADEDDAVRIANDSPYGLGGAVWSADEDRAWAVARRMRTGQVDINGGAFNLLAPFGGYKQSGNGREYGRWGYAEFLEVKAIQRKAQP
ncbi:aldehyde dehydrogenase family protein [Piscinibacter sakaiensis]|uniref:Aldehyde dehydrogenase n=1 Tax=Piscinibacter sakaiensis TaxID=1547922 RepID=A0A0K8NVK8_PISS1|nr:aldehyde dehydrogenase family protein [Piscinibacter sakaiensis]GAP34309.1 aldehyde dehydrogenase [Piscinibacter sakaiensis]